MASGGREVQSLDLLLSVRWSLLVNKVTLFAVKAHEQNGSMGWTRIACDPLTGLVPNLFNVFSRPSNHFWKHQHASCASKVNVLEHIVAT